METSTLRGSLLLKRINAMQINITIPEGIPEEPLGDLLRFLTAYAVAFCQDVSQPKPLARYIDAENDLAYPEPPYKEISQ